MRSLFIRLHRMSASLLRCFILVLAVLAACGEPPAKLSRLPADAVVLLCGGGREELAELATQDGLVDLLIPRGGEGLKEAIKAVATVPVETPLSSVTTPGGMRFEVLEAGAGRRPVRGDAVLVTYVVRLADGTIYFACDTGLFYDMKLIGADGLDLAVLPIGDRFTMGPADAVEAVKLLKPRRVAPAHYNTWPPIEQDVAAWAERIKAETKAEPIVVAPGDTITL